MDDLKQALFTAHFTNGRDLSDDRILAEIAKEIGLESLKHQLSPVATGKVGDMPHSDHEPSYSE